MKESIKIGLIGLGKLGGSIASALEKFPDYKLKSFDADSKKHREHSTNDLQSLVSEAELLVMAVRPQDVPRVCKQLTQNNVNKPRSLVSVCAGVGLSDLKNQLPENFHLIRVMPNVGALYSQSVSAICAEESVSSAVFKNVKDVFSLLGSVYEIPESQFDAFTALCASGPAFVFRWVLALTKAAEKAGFSEEIAEKLSVDMTLRSLRFLSTSPHSAEQWVKQVATPGGCTEKGLEVLDKKAFDSLIETCLLETQQKAAQLRLMKSSESE